MSSGTVPTLAASDRRVVIALPGLATALPVGGGCCATAMDDAVLDELTSWPAVTATSVDLATETVTVALDSALPDPWDDAADALRDLGLVDVQVQHTA